MDIDISPDLIAIAAQEMAAVAETTSSATDNILAPNQAAADAHHGWRSADALAGTTRAWEGQLAGLLGQLRQLGDRLRSSANDYSQADAEAARRLNEVLALLDKP